MHRYRVVYMNNVVLTCYTIDRSLRIIIISLYLPHALREICYSCTAANLSASINSQRLTKIKSSTRIPPNLLARARALRPHKGSLLHSARLVAGLEKNDAFSGKSAINDASAPPLEPRTETRASRARVAP